VDPRAQACAYSCITPEGAPAFAGSFSSALPYCEGLAAVNAGGSAPQYARWLYLDTSGATRFDEARRYGRDRCNSQGFPIVEAHAHREGIARVRLRLPGMPGASALAYVDALGEVLWCEGLAGD
jgi:hypothetical protein